MTRTLIAVLLTLGDPNTLSGGYLFHRRLAELAPHEGAQLTFRSFPQRPFPLAIADAPRVFAEAEALRPPGEPAVRRKLGGAQRHPLAAGCAGEPARTAGDAASGRQRRCRARLRGRPAATARSARPRVAGGGPRTAGHRAGGGDVCG